ncbi:MULTISPECIES: hypothetical protein [Paenibacillus]|uniref:Uncharacterized protein n=1 Tax=Paenibacillus pabuli TaxID=1472 RepID=A0A855YE81_9BACL|nr:MULTISPECIES: hypothetical protein [Paenibacillus]PWW41952.1 hypothetical protein DET56_1045 [Paenibacillus pabuli]PXW07341.1 hypothetical protein DEU73_1055 [Paenibacillus taichungensis]QLG36986.1 hypothetical protein HW560_01710 [Paenibacillus sp. E222]RAI88116.1 hypothetical protein DET54_1164 [Paenibacillus pabuli]SEP02693.1 hypothetical protein SAMN05518670_5487 [Paenibacillus sp. OK076]
MRKTDNMSKWKMGIGSAFLMVMLAGCGSGMQDLALGAGESSFVNLEAADSSSDQAQNQELSEGSTSNTRQEQQQAQDVLQTEI